MTIHLKMPDITELKPRITVFGVGGAGGNAVNNMIAAGLQGVDFVVANTDAQALALSRASRLVQMGVAVTEGLGAGSQPEVGRAAAEEALDEIRDHLTNSHMVFITAGMGGGTGTGAAPVVARAAKEMGILTVGVVTKPFQFEGNRRLRLADAGILELQKHVDTLIVIPNQNLFRVANEKTTFADAFAMADQVLYSGVACITDLMVKEGLINLDFADVRSVMREMGKAMMGTGEASGEKRALRAAEAAIANPLLDETTMRGARGLLISITGGRDMTLYELDEAATRIREEVDQDANIIVGATYDDALEGVIRVSVVATGIDAAMAAMLPESNITPLRANDAPLLFKPITTQNVAAPMSFAEVIPAKPAMVAPAVAQNIFNRPVSAAQTAPAAPYQQPALNQTAVNFGQAAVQLAQSQLQQQQPVAQNFAPQYEAPKAASVATAPQEAPLQPSTPVVAASPTYAAPIAPPVEYSMAQSAEHSPEPTRGLRIEDLPAIAQKQIAATRNEHPEDHAEKKMGLMQRLASLSIGRWKEDEVEHEAFAGQVSVEAPHSAAIKPQLQEMTVSESDKIKLDTKSQLEEDHLDIPAFLRRQVG